MLLRDFQQMADAFVLGIWPFYALAVGAVYILRRRRPDAERPYRTWGYPLVPAAFLLASVAMLLNSAVNSPADFAIGVGVIVSGIPAFYLRRAFGTRREQGYAGLRDDRDDPVISG